ncbi:hypothetical protein GCM10010124_37420 [Pilimelia terevasa]|uniref:Uncharacterized protein n=1 Tax=Pilimelia terevasa TaxID=53372 RepID=A0A8J3BV02_9ACTN|nr:hypothetical protein GCM10010124_37420 [Pilimelia terevasa]
MGVTPPSSHGDARAALRRTPPGWCRAPAPGAPTGTRGRAAHGRRQPPGPDGDGDVTVHVGAQDPHARAPELADDGRVGVPVPVAAARRDQRDRGADRVEEAGLLVGAAVVGDLQDLRADRPGGGEQLLLAFHLGVTGEQDRHPAHLRDDDQRVVVGVRPGAAQRGGRAEGGQPRRAGPEGPPRPRHARRAGQRRADGRRQASAGHVPGDGGGDDGVDHPAAGHAGHPRDVVEVEVAEDQQPHAAHPQRGEAAVDRRRLRPRVDDHGVGAAGRQDDGVALAHVARHRHPARRRPAGGDEPDGKRPHDARGRRYRDDPPHRLPATRAEQPARHDGQQGGAGDTGRPRQHRTRHLRPDVRNGHQPLGRPAGDRHEQVAERRRPRRHDRRADAQDGCRGDRRGREEIGRHRHRTHRAGQRRHHRSAGHLRRRRNAQCLGEARRYAPRAQCVPPARRHEDQGGGGHDRQHEARFTGQGGVVDDQGDHRRAQRRCRDLAPAADQRHQADRPHRGRPQDARRGPDENHETDERDEARRAAPPRSGPGPPARQQHGAEHDRHVAARHGDEVGHPGGAEVGRDGRRQAGGVAQNEPGEQPAGLRRQVAARRRQARAQAAGRSLYPGRSAPRQRSVGGADRRRGQVPGARGAEPHRGRDPLAGQQVPPADVPPQHDDLHVGPEHGTGRRPGGGQPGRHQVRRRPRAAAHRSRVVGDRQGDLAPPARRHRLPHRRGVALGHPQRGDRRTHRQPSGDRGQHRPPAPPGRCGDAAAPPTGPAAGGRRRRARGPRARRAPGQQQRRGRGHPARGGRDARPQPQGGGGAEPHAEGRRREPQVDGPGRAHSATRSLRRS